MQQALLNVLQPIFDPDFHPSSYGYRPGRSAARAVAKAERFMNRLRGPYARFCERDKVKGIFLLLYPTRYVYMRNR